MSSTPVMRINGTALPQPAYKTYSAVRKEVVNAARAVNAEMSIQRLASDGKYYVTAEWVTLNAVQKNSLLNLSGAYGKKNMSFNLTFISTMDDAPHSGKFYRADMAEGDVIGYGRYVGGAFQYYDVKLTFIEM